MEFPEPKVDLLPDELRWRVEQLGPDEKIVGLVAGKCVRVNTHFLYGRTQPCRTLLSGGKVLCECDKSPLACRVTGYQPVIRSDGSRAVVMCSGRVAQVLLGFPFASTVSFHRPLGAKRPLGVRLLSLDAIGVTLRNRVSAAGPQDIIPYLLHLWQDRALTEHFAVKWRPSEATRIALGE